MASTIQSNDCWVVALINKETLSIIGNQLRKSKGFSNIQYYIPTVKILQKRFKNKETFVEVPALFNYGFFKIHTTDYNIDYLESLKEAIKPSIFSWLRDPAKLILENDIDYENKVVHRYNQCNIATVTPMDIEHLKNTPFQDTIFSYDDIKMLSPGMLVTLKGYPLEGYVAKILDINHKNKKVRVELQLGPIVKDVIIRFENLLYTIYHGDQFEVSPMKEEYHEELSLKKRKI